MKIQKVLQFIRTICPWLKDLSSSDGEKINELNFNEHMTSSKQSFKSVKERVWSENECEDSIKFSGLSSPIFGLN